MKMTKEVHDALIAHARAGLPHEVCGYLAADNAGVLCHHVELTNLDRSHEHFTMAPAEQFAAVREIRGLGLRPAAVYHSHPETPARPSAEDIRLAHDPEILYVIVSLAAREPEIRAFRIKDGAVAGEELTLVMTGAAGERGDEVVRERDCSGVSCPMNMVYTKVELAALEPGAVLAVILDDGAPIANVPRSVAREGHEILARELRPDGSWRLLIRKGDAS